MNRSERNSSEILGVLGFETPVESQLNPVVIDQYDSPVTPKATNQVNTQSEIVVINGKEHVRIAKDGRQIQPNLPVPTAQSLPWQFAIGADERGAINVQASGNPAEVIEAMRRFVSPHVSEEYAAVTVDVRSSRQQKRAAVRPIESDRNNYVSNAPVSKDRAPRVKRALIIGGLALTAFTSFNASTARLSPIHMAANVQATLAAPKTMFDDASWLIKKGR